MNYIKKTIDFQKSLGKCCGSCEEDFVLAGFKAAMELAHQAEGEMSFTCEISNVLQREINRYIANEKAIREEAMRKIGL